MGGESTIIVAIDGPAASGKSTVAKQVAKAIDLVFVSSGEMYRAFTWHVLEKAVDPGDTAAVIALLEKTTFESGESNGVGTVSVNGRRLSRTEMSAPEVNDSVSAVAAVPEVRERLVAEQRAYAKRRGVVMEGRDIGSVVFPDTPWKFYIDASPEVREQRRRAEGITDSVVERDRKDSSREASPLVVADGAMVVDSSDLSVEEVVARVLEVIREGGATA